MNAEREDIAAIREDTAMIRQNLTTVLTRMDHFEFLNATNGLHYNKRLDEIEGMQKEVKGLVAKAKGGWQVLVFLVGLAGGSVSFAAWVMHTARIGGQ